MPIFFVKESLFSLDFAIDKIQHLRIDTTNKTRISCSRIKVQLDLLEERRQYVKMEILNEVTKEVRTIKMKITYDMIPTYGKKFKLQGHKEEE